MDTNLTCQKLLETLSDNDLVAFSLYYGLNDKGWHLNKAEIARVLNLSDKRVSYLLDKVTQVLSMSPCLTPLQNHQNETLIDN